MGAPRALLPYQGSKWRFRHTLDAIAAELRFTGVPERVVLTDPGPWGRTLAVVLRRPARHALLDALADLGRRDPADVFQALQHGPAPEDDVQFAAQFLFLQRLAFSGKAVAVLRDRWISPGFNKTSAYGIAATERFGAVKPMIPSLVRTLRDYDALAEVDVDARSAPADVPASRLERTLVYLDPPYVASTAYPHGTLSREAVLTLARAWQAQGATVMVSEQEALPLSGWACTQIAGPRSDATPFRGKQAEWVTYTPAA